MNFAILSKFTKGELQFQANKELGCSRRHSFGAFLYPTFLHKTILPGDQAGALCSVSPAALCTWFQLLKFPEDLLGGVWLQHSPCPSLDTATGAQLCTRPLCGLKWDLVGLFQGAEVVLGWDPLQKKCPIEWCY